MEGATGLRVKCRVCKFQSKLQEGEERGTFIEEGRGGAGKGSPNA